MQPSGGEAAGGCFRRTMAAELTIELATFRICGLGLAVAAACGEQSRGRRAIARLRLSESGSVDAGVRRR